MRDCQNLSRRQREHTPVPFALYLLAGVWKRFGPCRPAVLWVQRDSNWLKLSRWVDTWDEGRDAMRFDGPGPIIAHPTCGPWGKLSWRSRQDRSHGIRAMDLVHRYGGVVEQPLGSQLFRLHGQWGVVEKVNQADYGHIAQKATILYWNTVMG